MAPSGVKGGSISFSGCIQLMGFCTFEACVGIFWPSIMKMRSQYIPEEARSTIMNFFRIPLNIFVCLVLYNVSFPVLFLFRLLRGSDTSINANKKHYVLNTILTRLWLLGKYLVRPAEHI